jgi:tetratricopeptide (TPR) repeat protein
MGRSSRKKAQLQNRSKLTKLSKFVNSKQFKTLKRFLLPPLGVIVILAGALQFFPEDYRRGWLHSTGLLPSVTATPLDCITANANQNLILIAEFEGQNFSSDQQLNLRESIREQSELNDRVTTCEINHVISNREIAREVGVMYGALMVIYGVRTGDRVTTSIEVTSTFPETISNMSGDFRANMNSISNMTLNSISETDVNYALSFTLGQIEFFSRNFLEARALFQSALNSFNETYTETQPLREQRLRELDVDVLHFTMGITWEISTDYALALDAYDKAITVNPDFSQAHNNRGTMLYYFGRFDDSIDSYERSLETNNPQPFIANNNIGVVHVETRNFEQARTSFELAIQLNPRYFEAIYNFALLLVKTCDDRIPNIEYCQPQSAFDLLNTATELNPNDPDGFNNRGNVNMRLGNYAEAFEDYERAIVIDRNYAPAYMNLGRWYREVNDDDRNALSNFDIAISLAPDAPLPRYNRGNLYYDMGEFDAALQDYRKYIEVVQFDLLIEQRMLQIEEMLGYR